MGFYLNKVHNFFCIILNKLNMMEVTIDKVKNKLNIRYHGYVYVKQSTGKDTILWRCVQRGICCQGSMTTNMWMAEPQVVHEHNHLLKCNQERSGAKWFSSSTKQINRNVHTKNVQTRNMQSTRKFTL